MHVITSLVYFASQESNSPGPQQNEIGEVCIANISPREQRKRLMFAVRQLVVTLVVLGVLISLELDPLWRLPLFFMFSASTVSYFQVREKT